MVWEPALFQGLGQGLKVLPIRTAAPLSQVFQYSDRLFLPVRQAQPGLGLLKVAVLGVLPGNPCQVIIPEILAEHGRRGVIVGRGPDDPGEEEAHHQAENGTAANARVVLRVL